MRLAALTGFYVAIVATAQIGALKIVHDPITGRAVPGGTYLIGVALAVVELGHRTAPTRRAGWRNAQLMIAMGFLASGILAGWIQVLTHWQAAFPGQQFDRVLGSTWKIVAGSLAAFAVSESLDNALGAWARDRVPEFVRVVGTNLVSAPLDSLVFIWIAFGAGSLDLVPGQFYAKMLATVIVGLPLVYAIRRVIREPV